MEREERLVYSFETESSALLVPKNIEEVNQKISLVREGMTLLNLTSYNSKKASKADIGKIVPSNYIIIEVKNKRKVNPDYLEWYMDQSESFKKQLHQIKQGSTIKSISINEFRRMKISLPSLEFQEKLGKINNLSRKRKQLFLERQELLENHLLPSMKRK